MSRGVYKCLYFTRIRMSRDNGIINSILIAFMGRAAHLHNPVYLQYVLQDTRISLSRLQIHFIQILAF